MKYYSTPLIIPSSPAEITKHLVAQTSQNIQAAGKSLSKWKDGKWRKMFVFGCKSPWFTLSSGLSRRTWSWILHLSFAVILSKMKRIWLSEFNLFMRIQWGIYLYVHVFDSGGSQSTLKRSTGMRGTCNLHPERPWIEPSCCEAPLSHNAAPPEDAAGHTKRRQDSIN